MSRSELVEGMESSVSSDVSFITSLCNASEVQQEVEVDGAAFNSVWLSTSGLDDGITGKWGEN